MLCFETNEFRHAINTRTSTEHITYTVDVFVGSSLSLIEASPSLLQFKDTLRSMVVQLHGTGQAVLDRVAAITNAVNSRL